MGRPQPFRAGAARVDITPPLGVAVEGSFGAVYADRILDPLWANALVLDDGEAEVALVALDLCQVGTLLYREMAAAVERASGIPEERCFVVSSHTHNGPALSNIEIEGRVVRPEYVALLPDYVATAVAAARGRLATARLTVGRGVNGRHVFNRRLKRPDGSIVMNWHDKGLIGDLGPAGPVDPEVLVLRVSAADGEPLAFAVNHALHNNAAGPGTAISADFSGVLAETLRRIYGPAVVTLFLPGAMGDVNWIDHRREQDRALLYRQIGTSLAGTLLDLEGAMTPIPAPRLSVRRALLPILERPWDERELTEPDVFRLGQPHDPERSPFHRAYRRWRDAGSPPPATFELDLRALGLGDGAALVTNQSEFFVELGLAVKAASPFPFTFLSTLTNGNAGYVPTRRAFAEGGYEVKKYPDNSFLAVEAGEQIVAASLELLAELSPDAGSR